MKFNFLFSLIQMGKTNTRAHTFYQFRDTACDRQAQELCPYPRRGCPNSVFCSISIVEGQLFHCAQKNTRIESSESKMEAAGLRQLFAHQLQARHRPCASHTTKSPGQHNFSSLSTFSITFCSLIYGKTEDF